MYVFCLVYETSPWSQHGEFFFLCSKSFLGIYDKSFSCVLCILTSTALRNTDNTKEKASFHTGILLFVINMYLFLCKCEKKVFFVDFRADI